MTDIIHSVLAIKSDAEVSVNAEDINQITWHDGNPTNITNEEILAKQVELVAEFSALQYQRDRQYPDLGEQMDMQYWDQVNGTTTWKDAVAKVKSDNPKLE